MADKDIGLNVSIGSVADEDSAKKTGKQITKNVQKGIGNNGYIKLPVEITKFKYPKRRPYDVKYGLGMDYTQLQKAQDELTSSWRKLSKKGFSSHEDLLMDTFKKFRNYQKVVGNIYHRSPR